MSDRTLEIPSLDEIRRLLGGHGLADDRGASADVGDTAHACTSDHPMENDDA